MQDTLLSLDTESGPEAKDRKPSPIELDNPHDYTVLTDALESRVEDLDKLAKKTSEEGYRREARNMLADKATIVDRILPQCRPQRELPLKTAQQLRTMIVDAFSPIIRERIIVRTSEEQVVRSTSGATQDLAALLAARVHSFAEACFEEGYKAGYAARTLTFEEYAADVVEKLYEFDAV